MGGCWFWWYLKTGLEQVQDGGYVKISASGEELSGSFCRKRSVLVQGLFAGELFQAAFFPQAPLNAASMERRL